MTNVDFGCFPGYTDFAVRDNWSGGRFFVAEVYGCLSEGREGSDAAGNCGDLHGGKSWEIAVETAAKFRRGVIGNESLSSVSEVSISLRSSYVLYCGGVILEP